MHSTNLINKGLCILFIILSLNGITAAQNRTVFPGHSMGEMAGTLTESSVILQSRLTSSNEFVNHDIPGAPGTACFEISEDFQYNTSFKTRWMRAEKNDDYMIKLKVSGLKPGTRYYYRLLYGKDRLEYYTGNRCTFKTLGGKEIVQSSSFVVVTGMNYDKFYRGSQASEHEFMDLKLDGRPYIGPDRNLGFPAFESILRLNPDFYIGTGDNVYYDAKNMPFGEAKDAKGIRRCYHEQFFQPRARQLFANVPTYWEKDDHDYRYNDCDNTTERQPSPELGIRMFLEQLPVADPEDKDLLTYGTFRVSKDLQIWLVEGRDYRSPNSMEDGPDKTIWGPVQKEWLKSSLLESDATFRILISPTPMVGPDDAYKIDNHTNHNGFRQEGDAFFTWLIKNDFLEKNFYMICGDRHWQYHSVHPTGFEEFSSGTLVDANSRSGRLPGDPQSTDPDARILQPYVMTNPSGGFLRVFIHPSKNQLKARAVFSFFDEKGNSLYEVTKEAR